VYYNTIRQQVKAYIETKNKVPKGDDFLTIMEIADKKAGDSLKRFILEAGGIAPQEEVVIIN